MPARPPYLKAVEPSGQQYFIEKEDFKERRDGRAGEGSSVRYKLSKLLEKERGIVFLSSSAIEDVIVLQRKKYSEVTIPRTRKPKTT